MKKKLHFNFSKLFKMVAFVVLTFLTAQSSLAQTTYTWGGVTSSDFFASTNWSPELVSTASNDIFSINVTGNNNDQVTNATGISCRQITFGAGVTFTANANITTSSAATTSINGVLNVVSGTSALPKLYTGNTGVAGVSGVLNIESGATVTGNNVWRVGANASSTGTINVNGGTLTLGMAGSLSLGHSSNGTLNINSGTVNVNYTAFSSFGISTRGLVNIDNGTMIIPGDQTAAVQVFIDAGTLKAVVGKTISNTFDAGTNLTTVAAISALGVNDNTASDNSIVVYSQNQSIKINARKMLSEVKVYDLNGRLLASKEDIKANETTVNLSISNQVFVVKVTTTDGTVMTKKVVK